MRGSNVTLAPLSKTRRVLPAPPPAADEAPEEFIPTPREEEVLYALRSGAPMTDREICVALKQQDMNYVRPHVTRMLERGIIREHLPRRCMVTGKTVRTTFREDRA